MLTEPSWRDRLVRASFRGFEFLTDSHDAKGGRRLVVHEFPGADVPVVEDLGGKAWDWKLNAYFIGSDYDLERNALLAKLAEPGADWLMHPWLGQIWVRAQSWSLQESNAQGGYCTIAIVFVEGGESAQPTTDRVDVAIDRTRKFATASQADFALKSMSADGLSTFVAEVHRRLEFVRQAISLTALPLTWANQAMTLISGVKGDLTELISVPSDYAAALRGLSDALGAGADDSGIPDTDRPRVVSRITSLSSTALPGGAIADDAVRSNLGRDAALVQRLFVAAAAHVALADYRAEGDRDAALDAVVTVIDALLPGMPDAVFEAAVGMRTALIDALMAQNLKPASSRDVTMPLPAVVLAHRLRVDEAVFMARNAVRHPLFVSGIVHG